MTDTQLMTLALAIIIPLSLLLYSNSRITEAKETLRAEMATGNNRITDVNNRIADVKETLRAEMAAGFSRISSEIQALRADLKVHELEHHHK
jgi:predicted  nucleic acid-binding Zn-ribbon protein